ncbi:MAG: putative quinol monooxygenase [Steroidobacteraceae bacterium]
MSPLVLARFLPKPGEDARVEAILRGMVASTRQEPGCRRYDFYRATAAAGGTVFCLIEQYAGEEAIQAHRETPHYKHYRASIADLLAQPIDVARLEALDVRGESS